MAGVLYVVATPIGNLEDITLRALRVLRDSDLIAAEDTRVTRKLLSHFDIHTPLISLHQHSHSDKLETIAARLERGDSVALVSDAGVPGISDPGSALIGLAIERRLTVTPIPGASAVLCALVASGLPIARFAFDGFPPRTKTDRREFFAKLGTERRTVVLFEAPSRLTATLEDLFKALGDRQIVVCRELTKLFEEVHRGRISGALDYFLRTAPRGEFTLVVGPAADIDEAAAGVPDIAEIRNALRAALDSGGTSRDAVEQVTAALNLPRRLVYHTLVDLQKTL